MRWTQKSVDKMIHQKKNRGQRTCKIVKSSQSYSNGHLPYRFISWARIDAWRSVRIYVRSKDAQKQLVRTGVRTSFIYIISHGFQ